MALLGYQLDNVWNELQSRNGGHIYEIFFAWFEVGESISSWEL